MVVDIDSVGVDEGVVELISVDVEVGLIVDSDRKIF